MPRYKAVDICSECGLESVVVNRKVSDSEAGEIIKKALNITLRTKCRDCGCDISERDLFIDNKRMGTIYRSS